MNLSKPDLRSINEQTYIYLRQQIISNQLKPGLRINYNELSEEMGVSKTPLRDAINRLSHDGLVEIKPRSGTFVSIPNMRDAVEVYDVRQALERQALALSINRISRTLLEEMFYVTYEAEKKFLENGDATAFLESDFEFHQTIIDNSNNTHLIHIMENLNAKIRWFGFFIVDILGEDASHGMEDHKAMLEAMLDDNLELAMTLMENHIEKSKRTIVDKFS